MTPKTSQGFWCPPPLQNIYKIFIPPKIFIFLKTSNNIEIQNFEQKKKEWPTPRYVSKYQSTLWDTYQPYSTFLGQPLLCGRQQWSCKYYFYTFGMVQSGFTPMPVTTVQQYTTVSYLSVQQSKLSSTAPRVWLFWLLHRKVWNSCFIAQLRTYKG